jgi:hypothetical protein
MHRLLLQRLHPIYSLHSHHMCNTIKCDQKPDGWLRSLNYCHSRSIPLSIMGFGFNHSKDFFSLVYKMRFDVTQTTSASLLIHAVSPLLLPLSI